MKPGTRVRITSWAVSNVSPYADRDRRELIGRTGTVIDAGLYVSVLLDHDPAYAKASVIAIEAELEVIDDASEETNVA